jgi:hypothetical protein
MRIALVAAALGLTACAPQVTWYRPDVTAEQLRVDEAVCEYAAMQRTPMVPLAADSAELPEDAHYLEYVGQGVSEAGEVMGPALAAQARIDQLTRLCMESQGYVLVGIDSPEAQLVSGGSIGGNTTRTQGTDEPTANDK